MAHAFPRDKVRKILAKALGGWPESSIIFRDEPEPMTAPKMGVVQGLVRLDLSRRASVGGDEVRRTPVAGGNLESFGGQRSLSLLVRVESQNPTVPADDVLEGMRMRLNFSAPLAALRACDLALADLGSVTPLSNPVKNRQVSTAVLELFLNQVVEMQDPIIGGVIEKVSSGTPSDPGAAPVVDLEGDYSV